MSDRTIQRQKSAVSTFTNLSLASPGISTLANPIRGFGSQINTTVPQTATEVAPDLQEAQSADKQSLESEVIQEKPLSHDISRIPLHRPQAKLAVEQPKDQYEPEADITADQVMLMPTPTLQREIAPEKPMQTRSLTVAIAPLVQRETISSDLIQRDDTNSSKASQTSLPGRWIAPFELGIITNTGDATAALVDISRKLTEWKDVGYEVEMNLVLNGVERELKALSGPGRDLSEDEANRLIGLGLLAYQTHQNALKNLQQLIAAELDKFTNVNAQNAVDAVAEKLHQAFMDKESDSKIADIRAVLDKAKEFSSSVSKYVGYASNTKSVIKSAAKLDDIKKSIDGFKGKMSEASELAGLAESVLTLAGKVGQKAGGTQNDIAQFKSAFKIIDFAISKSNVPVIGQMWDGYIKPCAELCLNKLAELDKMVDEQVRLNELRLDEWWSAAKGGAQAPSITDSGLPGLLLQKYFVGGQPMLDFMWSLFRSKAPESIPTGIEDTFIKYRSQFNAGQEETNQIETDVHWYDPTSWVGRTKSPNLLQWVTRNKETVWSMLYGKLPHP